MSGELSNCSSIALCSEPTNWTWSLLSFWPMMKIWSCSSQQNSQPIVLVLKTLNEFVFWRVRQFLPSWTLGKFSWPSRSYVIHRQRGFWVSAEIIYTNFSHSPVSKWYSSWSVSWWRVNFSRQKDCRYSTLSWTSRKEFKLAGKYLSFACLMMW